MFYIYLQNQSNVGKHVGKYAIVPWIRHGINTQKSLHPPKKFMQGRPPISYKWSYNLTLMSMVITPQSPNQVRPFQEVTTPFATGSGAHLVEKHPPPVSLVVLRYHPARASTNPPVALSTATCHDRTWATARVCYRGARSRVVWKISGLKN